MPADAHDRPQAYSLVANGALVALPVLAALHAALFHHATLILDSGRDLANGLAIAEGAGIPALGPMLFGTWHLGPWWYVLLALPLWLFGSVGATALFVGVLAALKIPLAYLVGRRLHDAAFGLLLATCVALPGWQTLGAMVLSHTALAEPLLWAIALCCVLSVQRRQPWYAILAALLLALALHAHPTTLWIGALVAFALWRSGAGHRVLWCFVAGVAFVLPLLPVLLHEIAHGWPQLAGTGNYVGDSAFGARVLRIPAVLWGVGWHGSVFVRDALLAREPVIGGVWLAAMAIAWLGTFAGALRALLARDRGPLFALLAWCGGVVFVALLRDITPAWMTYALAPLQAFAWALAWRALLRGDGARALVATVLPVLVVLLGLMLLDDRRSVEREGVQMLPGAAVIDVAQPVAMEAPDRFWLTAPQHDRLARQLCDAGPTTLHGDLAAAFDFGQGVAARLHCGAASLPRLGGRGGTAHVVGIPRADVARLGGDADAARFAGFAWLSPDRVAFPARGETVEPDTAYRAERIAALAARGPQVEALAATCAVGQWLVVTNRLPELNPLQVSVRVDDADVAPTLTQLASRYYRCDGRTMALRMETLDVAALDVFVVRLPDAPR